MYSSAVSDPPYPDPGPILETRTPAYSPSRFPRSKTPRASRPGFSALCSAAAAPGAPARPATSAIPEIDKEVAEGVPLLGAVGLGELGVLVQPVGLELGHRGRLRDPVRARLPPTRAGLRPRGLLLGRRARGAHRLSRPSPAPRPGPGMLGWTRGQGGVGGWVQLGAGLLAGAQAGWKRRGVQAGLRLPTQRAQQPPPVVRAPGAGGRAALGMPAVGAVQASPARGLAAQGQLAARRRPRGWHQELPAARVLLWAHEATRGTALGARGRGRLPTSSPLVLSGSREEAASQQQQQQPQRRGRRPRPRRIPACGGHPTLLGSLGLQCRQHKERSILGSADEGYRSVQRSPLPGHRNLPTPLTGLSGNQCSQLAERSPSKELSRGTTYCLRDRFLKRSLR